LPPCRHGCCRRFRRHYFAGFFSFSFFIFWLIALNISIALPPISAAEIIALRCRHAADAIADYFHSRLLSMLMAIFMMPMLLRDTPDFDDKRIAMSPMPPQAQRRC